MQLPGIGDVIAQKYRIEEVLGEGGFGCVYRGVADLSQRDVAVKVMKPGRKGHDVTRMRRFLRELRAIAALQSPYTLTLYDYGQTDAGMPFMVTEYIRGHDLTEILAEHQTLTERETAHIVMQMLMSLEEAHAAGILHRDIKPSNIRIYAYADDHLRAKLLDFGLAQSLHTDEDGLTGTGKVIGTPRYMSPEQLRGRDLTPATDIYSLGLVALECLLGRVAGHFKAAEGPPRLNPTDPVSPAMREILNTMLAVEPGKRGPAGATYEAFRTARRDFKSDAGQAHIAPTIREHRPFPPADGELTTTERAPQLIRDERIEPEAPDAAPEQTPQPWTRRILPLFAICVLLAATGVAVAIMSDDPSPRAIRPVAPTLMTAEGSATHEVLLEFERGLMALDKQDWTTALEHFHAVSQHPETEDARRLASRGYVETAIRGLFDTQPEQAPWVVERFPDKLGFVMAQMATRSAQRRVTNATEMTEHYTTIFRVPTRVGRLPSYEYPIAVIGAHLRQNDAITSCYDGSRKPLFVRLTVLGSGAVTDVSHGGSTDHTEGVCVVDAIRKMRFPPLREPMTDVVPHTNRPGPKRLKHSKVWVQIW